MQETLLKLRYFEQGLSKSLKKLTLFLLLNPVTFNGQDYKKEKGPVWPTALQVPKQFQKKFFISGVLLDQAWWCNSSFSVNSKITSANLCKSTHDITNYSDFICPLFHCMFVGIPFILIWISKVWKGREKI